MLMRSLLLEDVNFRLFSQSSLYVQTFDDRSTKYFHYYVPENWEYCGITRTKNYLRLDLHF